MTDLERELTEALETLVYPPMEAKGILNIEDQPGPHTVYIHDPAVPDSFFRQVPPTPAFLAHCVELIERARNG